MKEINDLFFQLFTEKNSDQTKKLRLKGNELSQRIGKRLNDSNMHDLIRYLQSNPNIRYVDLSYNDIGNKGIQILTRHFFNNDNTLLELSLLHCNITAKGMKALANAANLRLRKLRLTGNKLGPEGAIHVGTFVENCETLESLDISETDQTQGSVEYLIGIFEYCKLKTIDVSRITQTSYYSYYDQSSLAESLSVYLKFNRTLKELHLEKCEFDGHDVELLLIGLRVHTDLLMLNLSANRIGDFGTELLAQWLKTRPDLIALRISGNNIGTSGALALSICLPYSKVRHLDLQQNKIDDYGMASLLNTIKKPTKMRHLFMWGNELGFTTLQRIERMLKSGVLDQEYIDVRIYYVDGVRCPAWYRTDFFKCQFYSVREYGFPPELKIKKNKVPSEDSKPRALIDLNWINRYPPVDYSKKKKPKSPKKVNVCCEEGCTY